MHTNLLRIEIVRRNFVKLRAGLNRLFYFKFERLDNLLISYGFVCQCTREQICLAETQKYFLIDSR